MDKRVIILNGASQYFLTETIKRFSQKWIPQEFREMLIETYYGDAINEEQLYDSLNTPPFGSSHKLLLIKQYNKFKNKPFLLKIIKQCPSYALIILSQDETKPSIKSLNILAQKESHIFLKTYYKSEFETIQITIKDFFNKRHLILTKDAEELLIQYFMDVPNRLLNELEKIDLYAQDNIKKEPLTDKMIEPLLSDKEQSDVFNLIDLILDKKKN